MSNLEKYRRLYLELYELAKTNIHTSFEENNYFKGKHNVELEGIQRKYNRKEPRFINVLHKYYLMATLGLYKFSLNHFFKIVFILLIINLRYKKFRQVVKFYNLLIDKEISSLQLLIPEININEKKHQIIKVILASVITKFINSNVFKQRKLLFKLEKSFYQGYYIGVTYIISDQILDSTKYSRQVKEEFHLLVQRVLSNTDYTEYKNSVFYPFVKHVDEDCKARIPFNENENYFKVLFLLEQSQYEDLSFRYIKSNRISLINKSCLAALKTQFSLMAVNLKLVNNLGDNVQKTILWALYCQMTDDIRDIKEDRDQNIQTLFTLNEQDETFNPYKLYIYLTTKFSRKYYAGWMFTDLLNILNDNKLSKLVKQDDKKINVFTSKILGLKYA